MTVDAQLEKSLRRYALKLFAFSGAALGVLAFLAGFLLRGTLVSEAAPPLPPGSIAAYYGDVSEIPEGWLLCAGGELPQGPDYDGLRNALARTPALQGGALPDLRGVFIRGLDGRNAEDGGKDPQTVRNLGEYQVGAIKGHFHGYQVPAPDAGAEEGEGAPKEGQRGNRLRTGQVGGVENASPRTSRSTSSSATDGFSLR